MLLGLVLALAAQVAPEREDKPLRTDILHADLPLFSTDKDELWPIHFADGDDFGCSSRFAMGDWREASTEDWRQDWLRLGNYGAFHCAYIVTQAHDREDLENGFHDHGWMIRIGKGRQGDLWAMQIGAVPGSRYRLFAVPPQKGLIDRITELQIICPADWERKGPRVDIWSTRYCAVPDRADLLAFARRMDRLPPLSQWQLMPDQPEEKGLLKAP